MEAGAEFPPLLVFLVGNEFLLVDGAMRLEAARRADRTTVRCEVRRGSLRDAILASCEVNANRSCAADLLRWGRWSHDRRAFLLTYRSIDSRRNEASPAVRRFVGITRILGESFR
jgi:ParB-like chromosome segregation protein Spo0J